MNEVEITITAEDRSGPAFTKARARAKAFQKDLKDAADGSAKDWSAAFDRIAKDTEKKIDGAMAGVRKSVSQRMQAIKADVDRHGKGIGDSFSKGVTQSIEGGLTKARSLFVGMLSGVAGDAESRGRVAGEKFGRGLSDGMDGSLGSAGGKLKGVFDGVESAGKSAFGKVGSAASTALDGVTAKWTAIGAAALGGIAALAGPAAGAITFAFGAAFAGLGMAAAAQSSAVQDRFSEMSSRIKDSMRDIAAPLEDSLMHVADVAEETFAGIAPELARAFDSMAPHIDRFLSNMGAGIRSGIGPALRPMTDGFNAVLDAWGARAPEFWGAMGDAMAQFGRTAQEHADDFASAMVFIGKAVEGTATVIDDLADAWDTSATAIYDTWHGLGQMFSGESTIVKQSFVDLLQGSIDSAIATQRLALEMHSTGGAARGLAGDIDSVNNAMEEFFNPAQGVLEATVRLNEAVRNSTKGLKDDNVTRSEREGLLANELAALQKRIKADAELNHNVQESTAALMEQMPALLRLAEGSDAGTEALDALIETMGLTVLRTGEATTVVDKYGNAIKILPNGKVTKFDADTAEAKAAVAELEARVKGVPDKTFRIQGEGSQATGVLNNLLSKINSAKPRDLKLGANAGPAYGALNQLLAKINRSSATITIYERHAQARKTEKARSNAHGGILGSSIPAYAGGGLSGAGAGVFALVGEQGPELVNLPYGSTVIPAGGTRRILDDEGLDYDDFAGYAKGGKTGAKKKPKPQAKKAKPKKAKPKKSIHQLTPSDVPRKKSIHQLTPSDVHGGSEGSYIEGHVSQGGGHSSPYADPGEVSVSNLEGGSAVSALSAPTWSGGGAQPTIVNVNLYVQGQIRSDRDLIALIRDAFLNGGFRGALPT